MGQGCGVRNFLYAITFLQLISTVERQVFDFLGFMWVPILANFLHFIFVILGIFGVYQYRLNYLISYLCWTLIWSTWNAFVVCLYLEIGQLDLDDDLLSFGTGSYSWWIVNGFGCNPEYFPDNSTIELDESKLFLPVRPTKVTGCMIQYQYVEVTHACIQLLFAALGFALGVYLAHHLVTVVNPRRRKSSAGNSAMYSIEYSPQVNESILNRDDQGRVQETDFYAETRTTVGGGSSAAHMTPRRVKRRSYTRNSTRSAGKVPSNKQQSSNRRSTRSLGRATGSRALNPVTRLMERDDRARNPIIDSSTSNDGTERYGVLSGSQQPQPIGLINHAFENSRPNSLYSALPGGSSVVSNQQSSITDCETISRPPSALTSYSNFHGQRRPAVVSTDPSSNRGDNFTSLTQESLTNHIRPFGANLPLPSSNNFQGTQLTQESLTNSHVNTNRLANGVNNSNNNNNGNNFHQQNGFNHTSHQPQSMNNYANNTSYDDLPPPPPPLASSPTDEILSRADDDSDSVQDSSISMPVPQQRNNARRNEYVNMPVSQKQQQQQRQQQQQYRNEEWHEPKVEQPSSKKIESHEEFSRKNENRLVPGGSSVASSSPDPSRSAPPPLPPLRPHNYANMAGFSYLPEPNPEQAGRHFQLGSRTSRYTDSSADESLSLGHQNNNQNYNDMMTLRLDARLNYHPEEEKQNDGYSLKPEQNNTVQHQQQQQPHSLQNGHQSKPVIQQNYHRRNGHDHVNGLRETQQQQQQQQQQQHRQISIDYFSNDEPTSTSNGVNNHQNGGGDLEQNGDIQRAQRVPTGHQRRDRASLRAKHKQDMEDQKVQKMQKMSQISTRSRDEDDYGFTSMTGNGRATTNNGGQPPLPVLKNLTGNNVSNGSNPAQDDKWYLHDSMRPVGAPQHGGNCKCYRCQRKLTAI